MNLNTLKTFILISETKNLTKAAELLNYSQSTVSSHIEKLEAQLNMKLFYRKKYGMELTEEGFIYIKYAQQILDSNKEFEKEIKGLQNKKVNLSINIQESQYLYKYHEKINLWLENHTYVNLKFKSAHSNFHIKEQISNFESDICLITDENVIPNHLSSSLISEEELILVSNVQCSNFSIKDISNNTILVTEKGCSYREQLEKIFYKENITPLQTIEFIGIESLKLYLIKNSGIALLPKFIVEKELNNQTLFQVDTELNIPALYSYVLYNPSSTKNEIKSFIENVFSIS